PRVPVDSFAAGLGHIAGVGEPEPAPHTPPPKLGSRHSDRDSDQKGAHSVGVAEGSYLLEELEKGLLNVVFDVGSGPEGPAEHAANQAREAVPNRGGCPEVSLRG